MREYLWIYQKNRIPVTKPEVVAALEKKNIAAACLGREKECRELSMQEVLFDERLTAQGIVLDKELLCNVGGLNRRLPAKWEYELALRVAEKEKLYLFPNAELEDILYMEPVEREMQSNWDGFCTDAYVVGRYSGFLREQGLWDAVLEAVLEEGIASNEANEVEQFLAEMLSHGEKYDTFYGATQPILIFLGDSCCYNVLNIFAKELADALRQQGSLVEFYDTKTEDIQGITRLFSRHFKAVVGFQAWIFSAQRKDGGENLMNRIGGPKYNFVFDHPIWMQEQLKNVPERYYVLTHDRNYVDFIKKYDTAVTDAYLLPPGGRIPTDLGKSEKIYDVTFLGTYGNYRKKLAVIADCVPEVKFLAARFLLYMKQFPNDTAEQAMLRTLEHYHIVLDKQTFLETFGEMKAVIQCVMYYYREKAVEQILQAGITLHVYGDSWKQSPFSENPHLIQHGAVFGEEALEVLQKSKISLNIMAWHKDGFTERIAESMLAGAVVVSDRSTQLQEFYAEEVVQFDLDEIEELPQLLRKLLLDESKRSAIAEKAEEKATKTATWAVRAGELLERIEEESRNR